MNFLAAALENLGEIGEVVRLVPAAVSEAGARGDLFSETILRSYAMRLVWLASDQPALALESLSSARKKWTMMSFSFQHAQLIAAEVDVRLYQGLDGFVVPSMTAATQAFRRAKLNVIETTHIRWEELCGRAALAKATRSDRKAQLGTAERLGKRLLRMRTNLSGTYAYLILAGVANMRGDLKGAMDLLATGDRHATAMDMKLHAAVARRRQGELLGGDEGARLKQDADAFMTSQGIKNPIRMTAMLAPGFD